MGFDEVSLTFIPDAVPSTIQEEQQTQEITSTCELPPMPNLMCPSCGRSHKKKSYYENLGEQIEQWLLDVFEMWKWNDLYKNDSWQERDYQGDRR